MKHPEPDSPPSSQTRAFTTDLTLKRCPNPAPFALDFESKKVLQLCNSLRRSFPEVVGNSDVPELDQAPTKFEVRSPIILWIYLHQYATLMQAWVAQVGTLLPENPAFAKAVATMRAFLGKQRTWGATLFLPQDTSAVLKAMELFLRHTLGRCELAHDAVESMCRLRHLDRPRSSNPAQVYAHIGDKDWQWSIYDFNFLPMKDLRRAAMSRDKQPLTFEPTGFVETSNGMGYMTSCLDPFSDAFTRHGRDFPALTKPLLEIGAAFGVAAIPALRAGAQIVANDLSAEHLATLEFLTPEELRPRLTTSPAKFPDEVSYDVESFSAILVSRTLHFLTIEQYETAARLLAAWLQPGGHLFVVEDSPYLGNNKMFTREYEKRRKHGNYKYPGMRENVSKIFTSRGDKMPDLFHFFDPEVLARTFSEVGLEIINCRFFPRKDYPKDVRLNGREGVGLIARKPSAS